MSVFTSQLNPVTGKMEWELQPENYDFQQEVARSAYADMLHDQERVCSLWFHPYHGLFLFFKMLKLFNGLVTMNKWFGAALARVLPSNFCFSVYPTTTFVSYTIYLT